MELRFIKDLAVSMIFILLLAFAVKDYTVYKKVQGVPLNSKYTDISVNEELIAKIKKIESSIQDRKMFTFNVPNDPLRQDPVIKDKMDREKEWEYMVANMVRLAATFVNEDNQTCAVISYQGKSAVYRVGDSVAGRYITDIKNGEVFYTSGGVRSNMKIQPIPEKPADISPGTDNSEYNY